jgi:diguanylate cyclase (GGDEF)-like protein
MQWHLPENVFYLLIVAVVSVIVCVTAFSRRRGNPAASALSALMLMVTFWTLFYILELSVVSKKAQICANDLAYIPIVTAPVLLLIFIVTATGHLNILTRRRILLLFIMPAFTLSLIWTSNYHSLFYAKIDFIPDGNRAVMTIERGLFYWINIVFSYSCLLAGTVTAFISLRRSKGVFKTQALILASGIILPWIGSVIDIAFGTIAGIHMVQAAFVVTGIIFMVGIGRYSFINFSPVGRHVLIDRMEELMLATDNQRRVVDLNPAMASFLKKPAGQIIGKSFDEVFAGREDVLDRIYNMSSDTAEISTPSSGKIRHYNVSKVPLITGKRYQIGTLVLMTNVTQRVENELRLEQQLEQIRELQQELKEQALRDPLTGLYNRRFLEEMTNQHVARIRRDKGSIGFLFLDIDNFKEFNDTYGHNAGDAVLQNLSRILSKSVRESDTASRYGGEEFLVLFINTSSQEILTRAENIRKEFETSPTDYDGTLLPATFSAGIAVFPDHGKSIEEIISKADTAMYKAKREGKNRILLYSEETGLH